VNWRAVIFLSLFSTAVSRPVAGSEAADSRQVDQRVVVHARAVLRDKSRARTTVEYDVRGSVAAAAKTTWRRTRGLEMIHLERSRLALGRTASDHCR
jgi:hypothetical protein